MNSVLLREKPEVVYDSSKRHNTALEELKQVYRYKDFIFQLIRLDLIVRYKRSILGVAWTMLNPLAMMVVLTIAFTQMFKATPAYSSYVLSGLIAWNFFTQTSSQAMNKLVWGSDLLKRIYMPRTSYALAAMGTGIVNLTIAIIPLIAVLIFDGIPIRWSILFLPVAMLMLSIFSLAVGLLVSTIAVYFPDFIDMYQILLMIWVYLTPVIYPEKILDPLVQTWLNWLNPMYSLIRFFRMAVYDGTVPSLIELFPHFIIICAILVVCWFIFTKESDGFSYRT